MAERKVRVGVVSLEHVHAPGLIRAFQEHPKAEVVAIAHEDLEEAQRVSEQMQIPRVYLSVETMLDKEPLDAVLCCAANAKHASIAELVLSKGLPLLVEKPMSATVADARRMLLAAQKSGTILMVNYPSTWNPALHKVKQLLDDGAIGQPVYFRWRAGHRGPFGRGCRPTNKRNLGGTNGFWEAGLCLTFVATVRTSPSGGLGKCL
jgi:predicted dehydrogenase